MKPATISEIKKALTVLNHQELSDLCLRLAKLRTENKELISYLVFNADNPALFIQSVKHEIDLQFSQLNHTNIYLAKKTLRKVLRTVDKYIKFMGSKQVEAELLIYFCRTMKETGIPFHRYPVTENIYYRQIHKIEKAIHTLHEDLQYDFGQEMVDLMSLE
jgi:hypothetical protein